MMSRQNRWLIFVIIAVLSLNIVFSQTTCKQSDIPKITVPSMYKVYVGEPFTTDINVASVNEKIVYSIIPIKSLIESLSLDRDGGTLKLNATQKESGVSIFLLVAVTQAGCYDTKVISIVVYDKPKILDKIPANDFLEISQTEYIKFYVNASSILPPLSFAWYLDGVPKEGKNTYFFTTDYDVSGLHNVKVMIKDRTSQNTTLEWNVFVGTKNRPPVINYNIPDILLSEKTKTPILNAYDFISDFDEEKLIFQALYLSTGNNTKSSSSISAFFNISFDSSGNMYIEWNSIPENPQGIVIRASDASNEFTESLPFYIKVAHQENYSYLLINDTVNETKECIPRVSCKEWSECLPTEISVRDCFDQSNCNGRNSLFTESRLCKYNASCFDNLKNGKELSIDCGGPCKKCSTCSDGIKNQNEQGIDCGGQCKVCPSCYDGLKNQDETDIDCGGLCQRCMPEMKCSEHYDCQSLMCANTFCTYSSCNDSRKNQGELNIDCGGPCKPCETCYDKILNQEELDVDCGGPCKTCQTCNDKIKNQDEYLTDCGGPCAPCKISYLIINFKAYLLGIIFTAVLIAVYLIIKIRYEKDKIGFLNDFSAMFAFMPKKLPENYKQIIAKTKGNLETLKLDVMSLEGSAIREKYMKIINEFYSSLFEIEGNFGISLLKSSIKSHIKDLFLAGLFLETYIEATRISPEKAFFKIELQEKIIELLKTLSKIGKLL